jgi:CheY-like chemotaxis protein
MSKLQVLQLWTRRLTTIHCSEASGKMPVPLWSLPFQFILNQACSIRRHLILRMSPFAILRYLPCRPILLSKVHVMQRHATIFASFLSTFALKIQLHAKTIQESVGTSSGKTWKSMWLAIVVVSSQGCSGPSPGDEVTPAADEVTQFKQIGLAFYNYQDRFHSFPKVDSDGRKDFSGKETTHPIGLSWRVHLLPFLGQEELYKRFNLDEPWDSANNLKLVEVMPEIYKSPGVTPKGHSAIHVFVQTDPLQPSTVFTDPKSNATDGQGGAPGTAIGSITDGLSDTVMVVGAGANTAEPWTKPGYLEVGSAPLKSLGNARKQFPVVLAAGTVRVLEFDKLNNKYFRALLTRNGGEDLEIAASTKLFVCVYGRYEDLVIQLGTDGRYDVNWAEDLTNYQLGLLDRFRPGSTTTGIFDRVPDLIVVGGNIHDLKVADVCEEVRKTSKVPIVCICNEASAAEIQKLLASGANIVLRTPLNLEKTLEQIAELTGAPPKDTKP